MINWDGFDAVLFDLDGTLVASMGMWRRVDDVFLGERGIQVPDGLQKDLENKSYNQTAEYFKERFNLSESIDEIKQIWHELAAREYRDEIPLKEGAYEFLKFLKANNIKTAIASSNSRDLIREAVIGNNIEDLIDIYTACDEVKVNKPDPAVYLESAKKLGVSPDRCLVCEDIIVGIQAGRAAGMRVVAVDDEYSKPIEEEKRELADYYIKDFRELIPDYDWK